MRQLEQRMLECLDARMLDAVDEGLLENEYVFEMRIFT